MTSRSGRTLVMVISIAVAACACMSVPVSELNTYRSSFRLAAEAGTVLLDQVAPIIARQVSDPEREEPRDCSLNFARYPKCFDPDLAAEHQVAEEHSSIRARRLMFDVVLLYNDLLLDIAEGRPVSAATERVNRLTNLLTTLATVVASGAQFMPVINLASQGMQQLLERLRAPLSTAALRRALVLGGPTVQAILKALEDDTSQLFEVYARQKELEYTKADIAFLRASRKDQDTSAEEAAITAIVADANNYHDSLRAYVLVLRQTAQALEALALAAQKPNLSLSDITMIAREAGAIRNEAREFWNQVRASRGIPD